MKKNTYQLKSKQRNVSALVSGFLVMGLLISGGVIGFSQVFKSQDVASQAAGSSACKGKPEMYAFTGTPNSEGCKDGMVPSYVCVTTTINTVVPNGRNAGDSKLVKSKVLAPFKKGCVKNPADTGTTSDSGTTSGSQSAMNCGDKTATCKIGETTCGYGLVKTGFCSDRQEQGVCCAKAKQLDSKPTSGTTTTAPATTANTTQPSSGGAPAAPVISITPPVCEIEVGTKSMSDTQLTTAGLPLDEQVLSKYFVPSVKPAFGSNVVYRCTITGGPAFGVHWALYRVQNNTYVASEFNGNSRTESSMLDSNTTVLQAGDHFECLPTYIDATGKEVEAKKCTKTIW